VVVAAVPWARHGAGHTRAFDDTAAWLAVHTSKQAVRQLLRVAWATVGGSFPAWSPMQSRPPTGLQG
jgi:transposase